MGNEKRDVKAASEKTAVQQQITAIAESVLHDLAQSAPSALGTCRIALRPTGPLIGRTNGKATSAMTHKDHIAPIQPQVKSLSA